MTQSSMRIDREGGLARLTLTQGDRGNPIDGPFCNDWAGTATDLSCDPAVRAILMTAEGKNFSVGGDIMSMIQRLDDLPRLIKHWVSPFHSGISRLQRCDAPLVAAVQGVCAGGGVSLIASADYVVAEEGALFVSAYAGIGYCCDGGASVFLSQRMGPTRAKRFLMMRETLDAGQALAAGLVDEVVPAGQLAARGEDVARGLASGPTKAYGELKRLFVSVGDTALEAQLELEALALARCAGTSDSRNAITAFSEKRKPEYEGR
jgi:2-(1,2-epoxy-1,2-dihydrophenyl)acetyl-CoA isomerase